MARKARQQERAVDTDNQKTRRSITIPAQAMVEIEARAARTGYSEAKTIVDLVWAGIRAEPEA